MDLQIDIDNVIAVSGADAAQRQSAFEAVEKLAAEAGNHVQAADGRVYFHCEWEPPFKALKKLSQSMPEVTFTLWADAFREHHWICKVDYVGGQGEELTLSLIDDDFPGVFAEIYGCDQPSWERQQTQAFAAWFPER